MILSYIARRTLVFALSLVLIVAVFHGFSFIATAAGL